MAKNIRVVIHHMKDEEKTGFRFLSAGFYPPNCLEEIFSETAKIYL